MVNIWHECLCFARYYAPRGRPRLQMLGETISQRYLSPSDLLIGILGEAGIGKSSIIAGMFPGLELTNDDEGINVRPVPLIRMFREKRFTARTFHVDARFELAFTQMYELCEAIKAALVQKRRVVVEHFDAIYPSLKINAQFLLGVGEDIIVTRPNVFGPFPEDVMQVIKDTAIYRKMAHSAEDITSWVLENEFSIPTPPTHSDVARGFVIEFDAKPANLDIEKLEARVREIIEKGIDISYSDGTHINIGESKFTCTGPRIHVKNSKEIQNFRLRDELVYNQITGKYCLVGVVADAKMIQIVERHAE